MFVRQLVTDVSLAVLLAVPTLALAKPAQPIPATTAETGVAIQTMDVLAERSAARSPKLLS